MLAADATIEGERASLPTGKMLSMTRPRVAKHTGRSRGGHPAEQFNFKASGSGRVVYVRVHGPGRPGGATTGAGPSLIRARARSTRTDGRLIFDRGGVVAGKAYRLRFAAPRIRFRFPGEESAASFASDTSPGDTGRPPTRPRAPPRWAKTPQEGGQTGTLDSQVDWENIDSRVFDNDTFRVRRAPLVRLVFHDHADRVGRAVPE